MLHPQQRGGGDGGGGDWGGVCNKELNHLPKQMVWERAGKKRRAKQRGRKEGASCSRRANHRNDESDKIQKIYCF